MAIFKTLRVKGKQYTFKCFDNEQQKDPAVVIFARFPLPEETFFRKGDDTRYGDVDFAKIGKRDNKEIEKLFAAFISSYLNDIVAGSSASLPMFGKVDIEAFIRECVERFEKFMVIDGNERREIKTVDDFLALPDEAVYEIAKDLYAYARDRDKFTMGESKA